MHFKHFTYFRCWLSRENESDLFAALNKPPTNFNQVYENMAMRSSVSAIWFAVRLHVCCDENWKEQKNTRKSIVFRDKGEWGCCPLSPRALNEITDHVERLKMNSMARSTNNGGECVWYKYKWKLCRPLRTMGNVRLRVQYCALLKTREWKFIEIKCKYCCHRKPLSKPTASNKRWCGCCEWRNASPPNAGGKSMKSISDRIKNNFRNQIGGTYVMPAGMLKQQRIWRKGTGCSDVSRAECLCVCCVKY